MSVLLFFLSRLCQEGCGHPPAYEQGLCTSIAEDSGSERCMEPTTSVGLSMSFNVRC